MHSPRSRVESDPDNRSRCVTVDVQAVFARTGNLEFVGGDRTKQNRLADRQITARGGMPGQFDFERIPLASHLRNGVLGESVAGDYAVETRTGGDVPTVDLRIDYFRPAKRGSLTAIGRTTKVGRRVSVADVEVKDEQGQVVAVGRGVYATPRQ